MPIGIKILMILLGVWAFGPAGAQADGSRTVAGADFCADQFILAFANTNRIKAVSKDSTSPHSFFSERAKGLHQITGGMEEILMLRPDLLVRSWGGSMTVDALLKRVGVTVYQPPYAMDYEASLGNFNEIAQLLGEGVKGQAFVADHRARYRALEAVPAIPMKAVYLTPSGFSAGEGTSVDKIIRLAGLSPIAEDVGLVGWGALPLEKLVMTQPDIVIGSFFENDAVHVSHWSSGRHGVFRNLIKDLPAIMVPSALMSCGGAFTVEAAEFIRGEAARQGLVPVHGTQILAARGGAE